jgi:hypothetical protein
MKNRNDVSLSVSELVQEVLGSISKPYPEDITDQVCLAIQKNDAWYRRYEHLLKNYGKWAVNSTIGRSTLQITGLRNLGVRSKATSRLIQTYTRLG